MKKIIYITAFFLAAAVLCTSPQKSEAKTHKAGKFQYQYKNTKKGVWITKITPLSTKGISKLEIPGRIKGKKVVKIGNTKDNFDTDDEAENLFGVQIADKDGLGTYIVSKPKIHKKVARIKKITIPSSVKTITPKCFFYLQDGKEINIPKSITKEVVNQFTSVKWKRVKIAAKNKKYKVVNGCLLSKNGKTMYGFLYKKAKVVVPKTVTGIDVAPLSDTAAGHMRNHGLHFSGCETIVIPAGVKRIYIGWSKTPLKLEVDKANQIYESKDGSVYTKKEGKLIWLYQQKAGVYDIPNGIKEFLPDDYDFATSGNATKIIIPESLKKVTYLSKLFYVKDAVIECEGKEPPVITETDWERSVGVDELNITVYVPKGCREIYESKWRITGDDTVKVTFIEK